MAIEAHYVVRYDDFVLDAAFTAPSRGITAIFGPSGCGKTSLLRAIAGLERGSRGEFSIDGVVWQDATTFLAPHKRPLGYVFQEPSLFPHLSVRANLLYGYKRTPTASQRVSFDQAVELLRVAPLFGRYPSGLSGGERQRVAIARALLTSPRLLLMDEALAALDAQSKAEILPFLERLHGELEVPMLYVSHATDEVARLADHLLLLDGGKVRASGPVAEMVTRLDLPLAHSRDAEAIVSAKITGHDETYDLSHLEFAGGRFLVPRVGLALGQPVRLRVQARDVSLTRERQSGTSILNSFPAIVDDVAEESPSQVLVRLTLSGVPILSRITRLSAATLELEPGRELFVQVKSVAVLA